MRFLQVQKLHQVAAARSQRVVEAGGRVGQKPKGVKKIGFAGIIASGQPDHVLQVVQFDALDAPVIGNDKAAQFEMR